QGANHGANHGGEAPHRRARARSHIDDRRHTTSTQRTGRKTIGRSAVPPSRAVIQATPTYFIVGMTNSAPSLTPDGQRAVTVLVLEKSRARSGPRWLRSPRPERSQPPNV